MQYFTVEPLTATAGSPPGSTQAEAMVKGNIDAEYYAEDLIALLRTGRSVGETAQRNATGKGWTLLYTGGIGDDEDGWIANCEFVEQNYPGFHRALDVRITFTDGPHGRAGVVQ